MSIKMTQDELNDINLIIARLETAMINLNSNSVKGFDKDTPVDVVSGYFYGVTEFLAEVKISEHKWRKSMVEKYDLPYTFQHNEVGELFENPNFNEQGEINGQ